MARDRTYAVQNGRRQFEIFATEIDHVTLFGAVADVPSYGLDNYDGAQFSRHEAPAWSRQGSLAFVRNGDVWLAQPEPSGREGRPGWDLTRIFASARFDSPTYRLSREVHFARRVSWSPDGRSIVFDVCRVSGTGTAEIHLLQLSPRKNVVFPEVRHTLLDDYAKDPIFSPDGKWIVYRDPEDGALWRMDLKGQNRKRVIGLASQPAW